ncbi:YrzI family small protein [Halalkalibacter krulwichiae]|uniref:Putative sporulation protein (Bac_small_yrzI) n=1 Tax=Halalkalibacter krulwichiae TaxID=199441 RepID=A0A1X9M6Y7_9BACI|nr:YrzI family small protein [Halalkalibacter krulwichiae]ARK29188.1 putative sporulation protein (Bac_small_yrzI) [Halalkalibacter krulwichiae]
MTFHFILFTITIKKRTYSGEQLEQFVLQQQNEQERQERIQQLQNK